MTMWDFSASLYPKHGVAEACLTLQNRHGFDVNVLLFCLWLAQQRRAPSAELLQELVAQSDAWRAKLIGPLRALRTTMKNWPEGGVLPAFTAQPSFAALRDEVKAAELHGEKLQQLGLEHLVHAAAQSESSPEGLIEDESLLAFAENWRWLVAHYRTSLLRHDIEDGVADGTEDGESDGKEKEEEINQERADKSSSRAVSTPKVKPDLTPSPAAASQLLLEIAEQSDPRLFSALHRAFVESGLVQR